jgi:type VI secretion system protein ImpG
MSSEERFAQSWLDELRDVESFRRRYYTENRMAQLDREDPDVRRMLEALSFSAVRTRQVTLRNLWATWRRLLGSYFDFVLRPLPAKAIAVAVPAARMTETAVLPKGTELRLVTQDGFAGTFATMCELRVLPLALERCELVPRGQGFRLVVSFVSRFPRTDPIGLLRLYVHYLDDYLAALQVHYNLRRHLEAVLCIYDSDGLGATGAPCEVSFGSYFEEPYEADSNNPLERVRGFFHFPEQELLINVKVPPPRRSYSRVALCFELDATFPLDPPIFRQVLCPFAVPVQNLRRIESQPIECDGTKDSYPIRYTYADRTFALQQARGVYKIGEHGLVPILSASFQDAAPSFDVEEWGNEQGGGHSLLLRLSQPLQEPTRIVVDGMWYQPEFADHATGPIQVSLPSRSLLGLEWQLVGPLRRHLDSPLRHSADQLLHLLSLKMKPVLEREELLSLLDMFGSIAQGPYQSLPSRLRDLVVEVTPDATLRGASLCHVYHAQLPPWETSEAPLVWHFLTELRALLDAWDYEARVELAPHIGESALPRPLPRPELVLR